MAWPRRYERRELELPEGASVTAALEQVPDLAAGAAGYAVFGVRVAASGVLRDGDRLELLRGLEADPKEARRRRAAAR